MPKRMDMHMHMPRLTLLLLRERRVERAPLDWRRVGEALAPVRGEDSILKVDGGRADEIVGDRAVIVVVHHINAEDGLACERRPSEAGRGQPGTSSDGSGCRVVAVAVKRKAGAKGERPREEGAVGRGQGWGQAGG